MFNALRASVDHWVGYTVFHIVRFLNGPYLRYQKSRIQLISDKIVPQFSLTKLFDKEIWEDSARRGLSHPVGLGGIHGNFDPKGPMTIERLFGITREEAIQKGYIKRKTTTATASKPLAESPVDERPVSEADQKRETPVVLEAPCSA